MKQVKCEEIISRLRSKIKTRKAIFGVNAGIGMTAKAADDAGADFIIVNKEEVFAVDGRIPAIARAGYGSDCNEVVKNVGAKILECVQNTPVIAGVGVAEPYTNIDRLTEDFLKMGFSGVTHIPTSGGWVGPYGEGISAAGVGYSAELEYIARWSKRGVFTIGYCFTEEQVRQMSNAGASVLSIYVPRIRDESHGWKAADSMEQALEIGEKLCEAARKENPDAMIFCSGGTFEDAEAVDRCLKTTKAHGYIGDDLIECGRIEHGIIQAVSGYKSLVLK